MRPLPSQAPISKVGADLAYRRLVWWVAVSRFAVIIPTLNRAELVAQLVQTVMSMEGAPDEIVVVDDGSTDDTAERLSRVPDVQFVEGSSRGPAAARNAGVASSSSDWLIFLDDDDEPDADWMTSFRGLASANPDASHLSTGYRFREGLTADERTPAPLGPAFSDVTASYLGGTFAVRRSLFDFVGGFDPRLRYLEFTDLALRIFDSCGGTPTACAADPLPHITYVGRSPTLRSSQNPHVIASSAALVLRKNAHLWRRDPTQRANQLATLGVATVRGGRGSEGGRILRRAAMADSHSPKHLARGLLGSIPAVRSRVWRNQFDTPVTEGPLVSVVIPTYGRQHLLTNAINSVLRQTYQTLEIIVVDDGSPTPVTVPEDPRIRLSRTSNRGVAHARNVGARTAGGEIIFFLDSDDEYTESRVSNAVAAHLATTADVVVCGQSWSDRTSAFSRRLFGFVSDEILDHVTPHLGATSIQRRRFVPFDERYLASQDVEWWLQIAQLNSVTSLPSVDCLIARHPETRHLNGPGARVEFGYQLLDDQSEYFASHPSARSFRLARLARLSLAIGDTDAAVRLAAEACRAQMGRAPLGALASASRSKVADVLSCRPRVPQPHLAPFAAAHARRWRPRSLGPPEARLVPVSRLQRVAGELAAVLGRRGAGYARAMAARTGAGDEVEIRSAFGRFRTSQRDHTLLHPCFFEPLESAIAARLIRPAATVLDIGANRGWYTVMAAALVGPAGRVLAVEPDDRMRRVLERNVALNEIASRVSVEAVAASHASGTVGWISAVEGSLSHMAGPAEDGSVTRKSAATLDELLNRHGIERPDFIKVDVEGAEFQVLSGCQFSRFEPLPVLMFEFQPEMIERSGDDPQRLLAMLWDEGYRILQIRAFDGDIVEVHDGDGLPDPVQGRNLLAVQESQADDRLADLLVPGGGIPCGSVLTVRGDARGFQKHSTHQWTSDVSSASR